MPRKLSSYKHSVPQQPLNFKLIRKKQKQKNAACHVTEKVPSVNSSVLQMSKTYSFTNFKEKNCD